MAKGNLIVVEPNPKGTYISGILDGTPKPGTAMEIKPAVAADGNGRFTLRVYTPGTNGDQRLIMILMEDEYQGALATTAYVTGKLVKCYCPAPGEQMNVIFDDAAGTGATSDLAIGDPLIAVSGSGLFIKTTGSPESEPFVCLEAVVDATADQLVYARFTGY